MKSFGLDGRTTELSEILRSDCVGILGPAAGRSTKDLVYGSQTVAEPLLPLTIPLACSALPILGRWPGHTWVAALDAAVGGLPLSVVASFAEEDELVLSFGSLRSVFNIPPFFSGLGVLDPLLGCSPTGGTKFEEVFCRLFVRGISSFELLVVKYEGRDACVGRGGGVGRGISV